MSSNIRMVMAWLICKEISEKLLNSVDKMVAHIGRGKKQN